MSTDDQSLTDVILASQEVLEETRTLANLVREHGVEQISKPQLQRLAWDRIWEDFRELTGSEIARDKISKKWQNVKARNRKKFPGVVEEKKKSSSSGNFEFLKDSSNASNPEPIRIGFSRLHDRSSEERHFDMKEQHTGESSSSRVGLYRVGRTSENQRKNAEKARKEAEEARMKAENARLEVYKVEKKIREKQLEEVRDKAREAKARADLAELELEERKRVQASMYPGDSLMNQ